MTGDGRDDVVVGAPRADIYIGTMEGAAYIFSGASLSGSLAADVDAVATVAGVAENGEFGQPLAAAGDVTGDGIDDVMIVAPSNREGSSLYLFAGGDDLAGDSLTASDATATISGTFSDTRRFAYSIANIGDVDNDGRPDIIVGSRDILSYGAAYVFSGADLDSNKMVRMMRSL